MIEGEPLPNGGILKKGVIYRVPAPRTPPKRSLPPEILAAIEREQRRLIREYLERRRAS